MTMASFKSGKPIMAKNLPTVSYSAGDVIVFGNTPVVAHEDNPVSSGLSLTVDAFAVGGGIYTMAADAAYAVGTAVYWNTATLQVTATYSVGITFPFGEIVAGPNGTMNDGGPTGPAGLCDVLHQPNPALISLLAPEQPIAFPRNLIDGGDFTTNPFQRGTSQASDITNSVTYGPDRWCFLAGASSALDWSQVADTSIVGFANSLKMQRKNANADLTILKMGQVLETLDCIRYQGRTVTLSFYAKKGANYSGGSLTAQVNHSTTAGNDTAAHLFAASTNWQAVPTIVNATQALTTTMTRYQFTGIVPATATQLGVVFAWTPTGTAGADDSITINGIQLEDGAGASIFEHRDIEVELALCQRYYFRITEVNGATFAIGVPTGANAQTYTIPLPTPMRAAPTVTVTAGGFKTNTDGAGNATPTGLAAGAAHSLTVITLVTTLTQTAAVHVNALVGTGTTGFIDASADL